MSPPFFIADRLPPMGSHTIPLGSILYPCNQEEWSWAPFEPSEHPFIHVHDTDSLNMWLNEPPTGVGGSISRVFHHKIDMFITLSSGLVWNDHGRIKALHPNHGIIVVYPSKRSLVTMEENFDVNP